MTIDFVSASTEDIFKQLRTSEKGLSDREAKERLITYGTNEPAKKKRTSIALQILIRFTNPLVVVLLVIAGFSIFFGQNISAFIVIMMAAISVLLSFFQEYRAGKEAERLSEMVHNRSAVMRQGRFKEILIKDIVPGDIVDLSAGDIIPADLRIFSCKDLFINQASLTGESYPAEKISDPIAAKTNSPSDLSNIAFMGSSVVSGTGSGVVIRTGLFTQFGELAGTLSTVNVETSFDRGIKDFTWLMIRVMLVMVVFIFGVNVLRRGNFIESLLFSLGVAVGLTPEMLPMLVTINLSKGAVAMSKKMVIVKHINSIQNFGAMDVLCTDKTGTLTLDQIVLEKHCDILGKESEEVLRTAYMNSFYHTGLKNLLDKAILKHELKKEESLTKIDEIPFDFERRIMSVIIDTPGHHRLISKGAPEEIFKRCTHYVEDGVLHEMHHGLHANLKQEFDSLGRQGFRILALAYKDMPKDRKSYSKDDENALILTGYLAFLDPPKPSAKGAILALNKLGIEVKVLTGDSELVAENICREVGLNVSGLVNGDSLTGLSENELKELVNKTTVFARLSPSQKQRVIRALHNSGHTVGYLGDGINDAPSLKASDVGISVGNAADIAKESADMILLKKSLMVLKDGVEEGRRTFGNIIKYVKMGASSNFGNMLSMTGASLFLPFLPMLPIQILLNNFLYDMSQLAIPTDAVDKEYLSRPRPWDIRSIFRFIISIGPISSVFDFITFAILLIVFKASAPLFHTGWFIESLCTQTLVIFVIRTWKVPFFESWPSMPLIVNSLFIVSVGVFIPFSLLSGVLGFVAMPAMYFIFLFLITLIYLLMVQAAKKFFVSHFGEV
jgi:P-type Mg2+ transporter